MLWYFFEYFVAFKKENFEDRKFIIGIILKVRNREIFEIERFEIKRGILPRAPTNVQGTEL